MPRFYPILDTAILAARGLEVSLAAKPLLQAGVAILQYRHKRAFHQAQFDDLRKLAEACRQAGTLLIVNDRADFAVLLQAGVHLGQTDLPVLAARRVVGPNGVIGYSTHNEEQLRSGDEQPADYLAIGPIFETKSKQKPDPVVGVAELARLRKLTAKPLVAVGGIGLEQAKAVFEAGADSIAVISGVLTPACSPASLRKRADEWMAATA
ncbi:MAG: thiamine phosphate synthase [Bryobacteraceae bacterium]